MENAPRRHFIVPSSFLLSHTTKRSLSFTTLSPSNLRAIPFTRTYIRFYSSALINLAPSPTFSHTLPTFSHFSPLTHLVRPCRFRHLTFYFAPPPPPLFPSPPAVLLVFPPRRRQRVSRPPPLLSRALVIALHLRCISGASLRSPAHTLNLT